MEPPQQHTINFRRSLVLTNPMMLEGFGFQHVLQTLIDRSGAKTTPLELYRQWFDTQNPKPGLAVADAPHCDDFITDGRPSFNGFPRRCPTPEGTLALSDPFAADDYQPIGITNRFDLTPQDGSTCGQYRIIYAKTTVHPSDKLHVILEGALPNPNPSLGAAACRPVAQFWADLSGIDSLSERRARVERFFFDGIDGFEPLLLPSHFAPQSGGGIRTAQLSGPRRITRFYQFHLQLDGVRLLVVPGVLQNTAFSPLFNASKEMPLGDDFRRDFLSQVATLADRDINGFYDRIPQKYLMVESDPEDDELAFASATAFNPGLHSADGEAFSDAITAEVQRAGSTISPSDVMARADVQNCEGCHLGDAPIGDGLRSPRTLAGTHIDESQQTDGGITRFAISAALRDVFVPNRAKILLDFLAGRPLPPHSN